MKSGFKQSLATLIAVGALVTAPATALADDAQDEVRRVRWSPSTERVGDAELDAVPKPRANRPSARERRLRYNARTHRGLAAEPRYNEYLAPLGF